MESILRREPLLLSVKQAAEYLGLKPKRLYYLDSQGTGPDVTPVGKSKYYLKMSLDNWAAAITKKAGSKHDEINTNRGHQFIRSFKDKKHISARIISRRWADSEVNGSQRFKEGDEDSKGVGEADSET